MKAFIKDYETTSQQDYEFFFKPKRLQVHETTSFDGLWALSDELWAATYIVHADLESAWKAEIYITHVIGMGYIYSHAGGVGNT